MDTTQHHVAGLLKQLAEKMNTPLRLDDGMCALFDAHGEEAVVLEAPEHSDLLLLHGKILAPEMREEQDDSLSLRLNFELSALRGCWLALDEFGALRLCCSLPLEKLDATALVNSVQAFIHHAQEVRQFITEMRT
ncbi:type III secretion system chaperone [Erwinia amylovora]